MRRPVEGFGRRWRAGQARARRRNVITLSNARRRRAGSGLTLALLGGAVFLTVLALGLAGPKLAAQLQTAAEAVQAPRRLTAAYYPNCAAAHAAGVYSIPREAAGYRAPLDADSDGLACEPYSGR